MKDLTKYKEIFGEFATDTDFVNEVVSSLNLENDSKILDVGTGMGAMSILLALNGFNVSTGEPESVPEKEGEDHNGHDHEGYPGEHWCDWRSSAKTLGVENQIVYSNFDVRSLSLTFPNQLYDGIFLYDALQHIEDRKIAINECLKVLKNNGVIVIIEWTKKQIDKDFKKYGFKIEYIDPRAFIDLELVNLEELNSEWVNVYLLRKC
jgi:ubiquinone/menaquinone biosynthesis C-methylase UbiE